MLQQPRALSAARAHAATAHGPDGGSAWTRGSARNSPIAGLPARWRNCRTCDSHMIASATVGPRWHPATAHRVTLAGAGGSCGIALTCSAVSPCPLSRVKQRWHTPPSPVRTVVVHPPARHTARPSSWCPAGRDSTRLPGSQPAPDRNRSEEHTSELQSLRHLVCRLLLEKKKNVTRPARRSAVVEQAHDDTVADV